MKNQEFSARAKQLGGSVKKFTDKNGLSPDWYEVVFKSDTTSIRIEFYEGRNNVCAKVYGASSSIQLIEGLEKSAATFLAAAQLLRETNG